MSDIFISHAVVDKALADKFVTFLKEAIGVPAKSIFCSSIDGHNIPLGVDFNNYMKNKIRKPKLVVLLMTPSYMESWFCLMELGATWAKSLKALPIVVPPIDFDVISSTLGLKQGWNIDQHNKLIDLRQMIVSLQITLEPRTEQDWEKKRAAWKVDLRRQLKKLAPVKNVSASDHRVLQDELAELKRELEALQDAFSEANDTIDELKAAKDPVAVRAIMAKKSGFDAEDHFEELLGTIESLRPSVSTPFYRNIIMDHYNKAAPIDWSDDDQKTDGEKAVLYKVMSADEPDDYLWSGKKLKKVAVAIKALETFLESDEAADFVREREKEGKSVELDDLEFWEENLR